MSKKLQALLWRGFSHDCSFGGDIRSPLVRAPLGTLEGELGLVRGTPAPAHPLAPKSWILTSVGAFPNKKWGRW